MPARAPASAEEMADCLRSAESNEQTTVVVGNNTKRHMGGLVHDGAVTLTTTGLRRVLQYEKDDLTISVEAGMLFAEVQALLARHGQTIALDPPFANRATVGGIIASNASGPMRRGFGTARDVVIGMTFATMEGKVIKTGGMVVKNVAGLDIGKLMIGSFGTLAVVTSVNFRVHSLPRETRTFLFTFADLDAAIAKRNEILKSVLQPIALDLITPAAAARLGGRGYLLAARASGSAVVLERYARELSGAEPVSGQQESALWNGIREFTAEFLARQPAGIVLRISLPLDDIASLLKLVSGAAIVRAGSGVGYVYVSSRQGVTALWNAAREHRWGAVVEFAPDEVRSGRELWLEARCDHAQETFAMMKKIKQMFDPKNLLNPSRLYGRI